MTMTYSKRSTLTRSR